MLFRSGEGAATLIRRCLNSDLSHSNQLISNQDNQVDAALLEKAHALFFDHYEKIVANSKPYEGVIELLQDLYDKGYKLACVTNKPAQFTRPILAASGLEDFFEIVISGDTLPRKKPDPMQLQYIATHLKVPMANALMVGDSITDVAAANAAGCQVVVVSYGYNQGNPFNPSGIHACIEHISHLSDLLL